MNKEKIRVLHILSSLRSGGVAVLLYNYYVEMNHDNIAFDFIVHVPDKGMIEKKLECEDSKVYHLPRFNHLWSTFFQTRKIIKEGNYKIVHVHHTSKSFLQLFAAWSCGVKVRIAHSHDYVAHKGVIKFLYKVYGKLTTLLATDYFACSDMAAKYVFGRGVYANNYRQVNNAISVDRYIFNQEKRNEIRENYCENDELVFLNVGRFAEQKNHVRLLEIFKEITLKKENVKLLLVGIGELEDIIKKKVNELHLQEKVIFLGESSEVYNIMQAADIFLLPSLHEGLGIVLIEAQVSGLPCFTSKDVVPIEVNLNGKVQYISLTENNETWAKKILAYESGERKDYSNLIKKAGYNLSVEAKKLEKWYLMKGDRGETD